MTDMKAAWDEVADSVTELGRRLREHYDGVVGEDAPDRSAPDRSGFDRAVGEVRATIDRAYSATGQAVKDPAVREDASKVGASLIDALSTTLTDVGQRLKKLAGGPPPQVPAEPAATPPVVGLPVERPAASSETADLDAGGDITNGGGKPVVDKAAGGEPVVDKAAGGEPADGETAGGETASSKPVDGTVSKGETAGGEAPGETPS